ncbi:ribosomal protein S18-alanine N-acetyltransferase [Leptodesmis sp.]|uniref:ribosomal protein S18-alanine N-acetyltransferase n=1 Tax=Leptodesmis sp. TaxID=3100501 RepID=UPI004053505C
MKVLELRSLTSDQIPAALELDRHALGGLWSWDGYQRELDSPNSDLLVLKQKAESQQSLVISPASLAEDKGRRTNEPSIVTGKGQRMKDKELEIPHLTSHIQNPTPHFPLLALGCSWAIAEEAHITLLAVDPAYQQQGLGQAMLYALLTAAYQRQLERATLEVRISNQAALALYTKFGFREAGRRKRYYQDTGEDALVLWRGGIQHPNFPQELQQWQKRVSDRLSQARWELALEF